MSKRFFDDQQAQAVAVRYGAGESSTALAREFCTSEVVILNTVRRCGVPTRSICDRRYRLDQEYFARIDTPDKAYWLGFLSADGHCRPDRVALGLAYADRAHIEAFRDAIQTDAPIADRTDTRRIGDRPAKTYRKSLIQVWSVRLAAQLGRLGLSGRKTHRVTAWQGPEDLLMSYHLGLLDGDGSWVISEGGKVIQYAVSFTGNRFMVQAFGDFVFRRTGVQGRVRIAHNSLSGPDGVPIWSANSIRPCQAVAHLFYQTEPRPTVCLERKRLAAERILATEVRHQDWSHLTKSDLLSLREQHGSWAAVARYLGMPHRNNIRHLIDARGIEVRKYRDWSHLTREELLEARQRLGQWRLVARELGLREPDLHEIKKRRGIFPLHGLP